MPLPAQRVGLACTPLTDVPVVRGRQVCSIINTVQLHFTYLWAMDIYALIPDKAYPNYCTSATYNVRGLNSPLKGTCQNERKSNSAKKPADPVQ